MIYHATVFLELFFLTQKQFSQRIRGDYTLICFVIAAHILASYRHLQTQKETKHGLFSMKCKQTPPPD